jgi:CHAD domain-containing protein
VVDPDPLADALHALGQAFTVVEDRRSTRRRTWLDTFDWRLYGAGLVLEREQTGAETRLVLTGLDGTEVAAGPDEEVHVRIASLIEPRALLPVAKATTVRRTFRLQNADAKAVARLIVEDTPFRLAVDEVRGYAGNARRARALLAQIPLCAVPPAPFPATATRSPGDYSGKIDAPITPDMPAPKAVAVIGLRLLDTLDANVDGVLRDIDTEFLHDLRVAVRRTRSLIKLVGDVLPDPDQVRAFAAEFKWLGDMTTPVRDLDVHLLGFDDLAATLVAASRDDLQPFHDYLSRDRAIQFRRLARVLRSQRFRAIIADWRKVLENVPAGSRDKTVASLAANRTKRAIDKLLRHGGAITASSPAESLHDLRKRAKELRYLLEFFAPVQDRGDLVGDLKKLQDCLGDFQDSQVQREELARLADAMLAAGTIPRRDLVATLLAMGEISADLTRRQQAAREDFARRFERFARTAGAR